MLKDEIRAKWDHYCDTDKLVDNIRDLLTKYHHDNTEEGVCAMLNVYFTNKRNLIDLFMGSTSYIGDMRICLNVELERSNDGSDVKRFISNFGGNVEAYKAIYKYVDQDGKTLEDYIRTGVGRFKARNLHHGNIVAKNLIVNREKREQFRPGGETIESHGELVLFNRIKDLFQYNTAPTLDFGTADTLTHHKINGKFVEGMKTSRAFNRVCTHFGVDKLPNYNRLFAQYADMVSGLKRKVKFYISLNPLDYLTMSFGNSWSSCHTIDKKNERDMPSSYQGMHCGGTMSYMLDKTSIITYVHDHAMENYEEGKIYRNMFHYNNGTLIQGRVYPQGNDGATDLYREFRSIMQGELSRLLNLNANDWIKRTCGCGENTASHGVHYADYLHFSGCNVSYPREMSWASDNVVHIGHERICTLCGRAMSDDEDSGYFTHENCDDMDEADGNEEW